MSAVKIRRCPKCRCESLSIHETHEEHGVTDFGRVVIEDGALLPPSDFWFSAGEPTSVRLTCGDCGHRWASRLPVGAPIPADLTLPTPTQGETQ